MDGFSDVKYTCIFLLILVEPCVISYTDSLLQVAVYESLLVLYLNQVMSLPRFVLYMCLKVFACF